MEQTLFDTVYPLEQGFQPGELPFCVRSGGHFMTNGTYCVDRQNYPFYLLTYTEQGEGNLSYAGKTFRLGKGAVFLIDCRLHQIYCCAEKMWEFQWIHFSTENCPGCVDKLIGTHGPVFICPEGEGLRQRIIQVHTLFREHAPLADLRASCLVTELITQLYTCQNAAPGASQDTLRVMELIEANYAHKLTLDDISKSVSRSKYYLSHEFKWDTGLGIYTYLILFRISKGKTLLQSTNLSVAEIAEQTGFESVSNFIRTFSAYESVTPHQYRQRWK